MKKLQLRKLIRKVINEQLGGEPPFPYGDKDIVGPCQNKELFELSQDSMQAIIPGWAAWAESLENIPDNPTFTIGGPEAAYLAVEYIFAAGESNFNDFYFSVVNSIPSDLGADFPSPMCPYGYVSTMTATITVNQQPFDFSFFNAGDLIGQIQSTTWAPTLFGTPAVGGFDNINDFQDLFDAIIALNQSSETISIYMSFPPITVNMCNCVWTDVIQGCMDTEACNYDSSAMSDDGSCIYPNQCGSCTGDVSCIGCIDSDACNYDSTLLFVNNDLCDYVSCVGCTNENATNYNPQATTNVYLGGEFEGEEVKCEFEDTVTDYTGPYSPASEPDDESVPVKPDIVPTDTFGDPVSPVRPRPLTDKPLKDKPGYTRPTGLDRPIRPGDEELIPVPIPGCTDPTAFNYNPDATEENGSCVYEGPGAVFCNTDPVAVCFPECEEQFDCQGCFDNYVEGSGIYLIYAGPGSGPFGNFGPCQGLGYYDNQSSPTVDDEDNVLRENFIKRFQKLANIKKKK